METIRYILKNQFIDVIDEREALSTFFMGLLKFSIKVLTFSFITMMFFMIIFSDFTFKGEMIAAAIIVFMLVFMRLLDNKVFREIMLYKPEKKG